MAECLTAALKDGSLAELPKRTEDNTGWPSKNIRVTKGKVGRNLAWR